MFQTNVDELTRMGAIHTTSEIKQEPRLWEEAFDIYRKNEKAIGEFLDGITAKFPKVFVILAGAGSSAFAGDTALPHLKQFGDISRFDFECIPTTSLVSNPQAYLKHDVPTLMVSYGRSGNSPESVAAVNLGKQIVKDFYQITLVCAPDSELANAAKGDPNNFLLLMPEDSHDKAFAMTGSFTCMALSTLLIFDPVHTIEQKEQYVKQISAMGRMVLEREDDITALLKPQHNRLVYLGSGPLAGLAREAQLKILELTAGKIATCFESSMGFRHGPKSFLDGKTIVLTMVSNNPYTRKYDLDILEEMKGDGIAAGVVALQVQGESGFSGIGFEFPGEYAQLPDAYIALPYLMVAQTIALHSSVNVGNTPDTPSPSGTVNRVVKGVVIHPLP